MQSAPQRSAPHADPGGSHCSPGSIVALPQRAGIVLVVVVVVVVVEVGGAVVVVVVAPLHDGGAGAFRAAKRPGRSRPTVPPKRAHQRVVPVVNSTATLPCDGSSSVMPVDSAETRSVAWSFTSATFTADGPPGAAGFRYLYAVPAAFNDQPDAGRSRAADSPEAARTATVAPTTVGSSGPPGDGATIAVERTTKSIRCAPDESTRSVSVRPGTGCSTAWTRPAAAATSVTRSVAVLFIVSPLAARGLGAGDAPSAYPLVRRCARYGNQ